MYTVHNVQLICTFFICFYLHNVHIKECTFDIFDKPSLQVYQKKELTNVIQEQAASFNIYQDLHRPLLREEGDGAPASSGTQ